MMQSTADRAAAISRALDASSGWAMPVSADDMMALVATELGDEGALDGFIPAGGIRSQAIAPRTVLHITSGNTPAAAVQSLARGLLLGSHNLVKAASDAPTFAILEAFVARLPPVLREAVELSQTLPDDWLGRADAVVVFGSDETIAAVGAKLPSGTIFQPHGHRLSFSVIYDDTNLESVAAAARDVFRFDQNGCLSPHDIYVDESSGTGARRYAEALATEFATLALASPPAAPPDPAHAAEVQNLRCAYTFRAANDPSVEIWHSEGGRTPGWTVVYEDDGLFAVSPLLRTVFVKPAPADLDTALRLVRPHLSTVSIWPFDHASIAKATAIGAPRVCALGDAQSPSLFWHQDGARTLAPLVTWRDCG